LENQVPPPPPPQSSPIPVFEGALVIAATFFVSVFLSVASLIFLGDSAALIIGELLILIVPLIYLLMKHVDIKNYVRIDLNPKYVFLGVGCGVLLLFLNIAISETLTYFFGTSNAVQESNQLLTTLSAQPSGLVAVAASLVLAGICEEFAFRGFLQNSIFRSMNAGKYQKFAFPVALVVAAGVFGLFHLDPQGIYTLAAAISGLALGLIYHRWNYTTSATAHAFMNILVLVLLLIGIG
jgi:membrane protease YdiL (CAAX protease family)